MRLALVATVGCLVLVGAAGRGSPEESASPVGPRVRVTSTAAPSGPVTGTLVGIDDEALTVLVSKKGEPVRLRRAVIDKVEVSQRRGNRGKAMALGFVAGAAIGAIIGATQEPKCEPTPHDQITYFDLCLEGLNTAGGGVVGAPIGLLLGLGLSHGERWEPTPLDDLSIAIGPTRGGAAFSVRIGF